MNLKTLIHLCWLILAASPILFPQWLILPLDVYTRYPTNTMLAKDMRSAFETLVYVCAVAAFCNHSWNAPIVAGEETVQGAGQSGKPQPPAPKAFLL